MILEFIVACHVSTIPKSPPKIIRENTYTGFKESQFFLRRAEARAKRETKRASTKMLVFVASASGAVQREACATHVVIVSGCMSQKLQDSHIYPYVFTPPLSDSICHPRHPEALAEGSGKG